MAATMVASYVSSAVESIRILCGPQYLCNAAQIQENPRADLIEGYGIGTRQGHHVEHLVVARAHNNDWTRGEKDWSFPRGWYQLVDAWRQHQLKMLNARQTMHSLKKSDMVTECYVLFVSREHHVRHLDSSLRDKLASTVSRWLVPPRGCTNISLKVFNRPQSPMQDATLFYGASAVIGVHGGALSNLVYCQHGTIVIEVLPQQQPRMFFAAVAYSRNLTYYTYTPSAWNVANWYGDGDIPINASHFMAVICGIFRVHGRILV
eukprot:SAG31_NODE_11872_length_990_cov_1.021324_1_plen_263_part_10